MKIKTLSALALAAALCGCGEEKKVDEARLFGYTGADLDEDAQIYFVTGAAVTNWVPARVLAINEKYEFEEAETALLAAAGTVRPGEPLKAVPQGYAKDDEGPWFTYFDREAKAFDATGKCGFLGHYDEDSATWQVTEAYFSSYHKDEASALAALKALRGKVAASKFAPKRFFDFPNSFAAEYRRLAAIAVVGQRTNGVWSCMFSLRDKQFGAASSWVPIAEQREMVAQARYAKAVAAWRKECAKKLADNHEAVEKARAARKLKLLGETKAQTGGNNRMFYVRFGTVPPTDNRSRDEIVAERCKALAEATGTVLAPGAGEKYPDGAETRLAEGTNALYEVRLDMFFPPTSTNAAPAAAEGATPIMAEWRELCVEKIQPGFEMPPPPAPPADEEEQPAPAK